MQEGHDDRCLNQLSHSGNKFSHLFLLPFFHNVMEEYYFLLSNFGNWCSNHLFTIQRAKNLFETCFIYSNSIQYSFLMFQEKFIGGVSL